MMKKRTNWIRLIAQILSIIIFAFLVIMFVGEATSDAAPIVWPTLSESIAMIFFPVGVVAGLIIAWKREVLGGIINIVSMVIFYIYMCGLRGRLIDMLIWVFFIIPGILFIISGYQSKKQK